MDLQEKQLANLLEMQNHNNKEIFIQTQSSQHFQSVSEKIDQVVPKMRFKPNQRKDKTRSISQKYEHSEKESDGIKENLKSIIKKKSLKKKRITKPTGNINTTYEKIQEAKNQLEEVFKKEKEQESKKIKALEDKIELLTKTLKSEQKSVFEYEIKSQETSESADKKNELNNIVKQIDEQILKDRYERLNLEKEALLQNNNMKAHEVKSLSENEVKYEKLLQEKQHLEKLIGRSDKTEQDLDNIKFASEMNLNSIKTSENTTNLNYYKNNLQNNQKESNLTKNTFSSPYKEPNVIIENVTSESSTQRDRNNTRGFRCPKPPTNTDILSEEVFIFKTNDKKSNENTKKMEEKKILDTEKLALNRKVYFDEIIKAEEEKLKRTQVDLQKERDLIKDLSEKTNLSKEFLIKINNDLETGRLKKEAEVQKHQVLIKKLEEKRREIDIGIQKDTIHKKRFVETEENETKSNYKKIHEINQKHKVLYENSVKRLNEGKSKEKKQIVPNDSIDVRKVQELRENLKNEEIKLENIIKEKNEILKQNSKNVSPRPQKYVED